MAKTRSKIEEKIERLIRAEFDTAAIEGVRIQRDHDIDGDSIYRIIVALGSQDKFDAVKANAVMKKLFSMLHEFENGDNEGFPLLSFLSAKDYARLSEAA